MKNGFVVLWRLHNGAWDPVGDPRPAREAGRLLATAQEANARAGSGDTFAVLPAGEQPDGAGSR